MRKINAQKKRKTETGFPIFYVRCPQEKKEISADCCDIRFCTKYKGRREYVDRETLEIACDWE